jgi:hypothetical protein
MAPVLWRGTFTDRELAEWSVGVFHFYMPHEDRAWLRTPLLASDRCHPADESQGNCGR